MKKRPTSKKPAKLAADVQPEYDLATLKGGVQGKYLKAYRAGTNLALLAPEIRRAFPTDQAVNDALRSVLLSRPD